MPFPLTHLMIGNKILETSDVIKSPYDFLMGSIAPDAVHHREGFNRDMKSVSHLCVGEEPWGMVTKNDWWRQNVMDFLEANRDHPNIDFIYGYCAHVLGDIQNNIKIWIPFRTNNSFTVGKGLSSQYHEESKIIDAELFHSAERVKVWEILKEDGAIDCGNMDGFTEKDLMKIKNHLLFTQYKDCVRLDDSNNKYVTMDIINQFIDEEARYIKELIFG